MLSRKPRRELPCDANERSTIGNLNRRSLVVEFGLFLAASHGKSSTATILLLAEIFLWINDQQHFFLGHKYLVLGLKIQKPPVRSSGPVSRLFTFEKVSAPRPIVAVLLFESRDQRLRFFSVRNFRDRNFEFSTKHFDQIFLSLCDHSSFLEPFV